MQFSATDTAAKQTLKCSWKLSVIPLKECVECNDGDKWLTLLCLIDIKLHCTAGSVGFCNTSVHFGKSRFQMENLNSVRESTWKPCVPEARLSSVSNFSGDNCFMLSSSGDFSLKVKLIPGFRHPLQGSSLQGRRLKIWIWSVLSQQLTSVLMAVEHGPLDATLSQEVLTLTVARSCEGKGEIQLKTCHLQPCPKSALLTPFRTVSWVEWIFALTQRDCSCVLPWVNNSTSVHLHFQV